jgi:[ribosomal protein S5]-alanine N-acetyltransferase
MATTVQIWPWRLADAPVLTLWLNNKRIWDNLRDRVPHPYRLSDAVAFIAAQQNLRPAQNLAILHLGAVVGGIGLELRDDVARQTAELGYWVAEPYWGMGIATEAVKLMEAHAFAHFDLLRLEAEVFASNTASMKVLQKTGFEQESVRRQAVVKNGVVMDSHVWVRLKPGFDDRS